MKDKTLQIQLDEVEKKIKIQNQNINANSNKKLQEINQKVIAMQNSFNCELETIKQKIELIEEGAGGGGGETENDTNLARVALTGNYLDLTSRPDAHQDVVTASDEKFDFFNELYLDSTLTTPRLYFSCSPEKNIQGIMKVYCSISSFSFSCNETCELWLNDEVKLGEVNFTTLYPSAMFKEIAFSFRPKKVFNYFTVVVVPSPLNLTFRIDFLKADFTKGKNIYVINRQNTKKIAEYQGKYVLYSNLSGSCYATICDKNTFNTTTFTFEHLTKFFGSKPSVGFVPIYTKPNTIEINTNTVAIVGNNYNFLLNAQTPVYENVQTLYNFDYGYAMTGVSMTYFREDFSNFLNVPGVAGVSTVNGRLAFVQPKEMYGDDFTVYFEYKINDEFVESALWLENVAVTAQDLTNINPLGFKGSVGVKVNGECVFFPHFNSTYCLPLGRGRNVHALIQENGDIDVYLGQIGFVIKKTLRKNSQEIYEIFKEKRIYGFDECIETTDGKILEIVDNEFLLDDVRD